MRATELTSKCRQTVFQQVIRRRRASGGARIGPLFLTMRRCQASRVAGVTIRCSVRTRASTLRPSPARQTPRLDKLPIHPDGELRGGQGFSGLTEIGDQRAEVGQRNGQVWHEPARTPLGEVLAEHADESRGRREGPDLSGCPVLELPRLSAGRSRSRRRADRGKGPQPRCVRCVAAQRSGGLLPAPSSPCQGRSRGRGRPSPMPSAQAPFMVTIRKSAPSSLT